MQTLSARIENEDLGDVGIARDQIAQRLAIESDPPQLGAEAATASMDERQRAFLEAYPAWLTASWALAVWTGLLATLFLLLRKALAAPLFGLAFVCMAITTVRNFVLEDGAEVLGSGGVTFAAVIFVVCLGQLLYARAMAARGVLR